MIGFDDHRQIERLVHLYPYYLDSGRFTDLGELFAGADLYAGDTLLASHDPAAVTAVWQRHVRIHPSGTPRTRHLSSNLLIDADGPDRARAYSCILVVQHVDGFPLQPITAGDYVDRFARVDGVWRFTERRIGNDLFGDLSRHLLESMDTPVDARPQRWERR